MPDFPPFSTQVDQARYCFFQPRTTRTPSLQMGAIGLERCRPDYRISRPDFAGYAIEFVATGRGTATLDGKSWPLSPGTLFCYGPKTPHVITTDRREVMTKYFVDFFGGGARAMLSNSPLRPGEAVYPFEIESFRGLFESMLAEGGKSLPSSSEICVRYLQILLLKARETVSSEGEQPSHAFANFQQCRAFIDSHFLEIQDLEDVSRKLHLTPAYLCRLFQKFGQPGPFQYLTRKKLSRAAELLVGQGCAVKEAAAAVGYRDPYHFSRAFSRFFGMSPTAFVRNRRRGR